MIDLFRHLGIAIVQGAKFAQMGLVLWIAFRRRGAPAY